MSLSQTTTQDEQNKAVIALAEGFDTLIELIQKLVWQERELSNRLQFAYDEYLNLASQLTSCSASKAEIAEMISPMPFQPSNYDASADHTRWIYDGQQAGYITSSELEVIAKGLEAYRILADKLVTQNEYNQNNNTYPPMVHAKASCPLEHDSTAENVQDLRSQDLDPIKAEALQDTPSPLIQDAAPRCPIRYLDDHSPEEVAKYFQKNKHRIPRSHTICIQRYQRDAKSIRQLDEKYGDMVNMIKGLSLYHQPYLPSTQEPGRPNAAPSVSIGRIEKWAKDVNAESTEIEAMPLFQRGEHGERLKEKEDEEQGDDCFDRSLRDVRLGESASRPWGIHVPISQTVAQQPRDSSAAIICQNGVTGSTQLADYNRANPEHSSVSASWLQKLRPLLATSRCPFYAVAGKDHRPLINVPGSAATDIQAEENYRCHTLDNLASPLNRIDQPQTPTSPIQSKMVFQGPVFLGYPAEHVITFLQQLSHSRSVH
ncbi:hypothetical protein I7I50_01558 [Histoplasma capsulatum G186AR]|uniref:Uncharacterized protein n=1 Tax=Ajellomyces capsulatus TaxID=5037 RepID=A0A8H7YGH7_AJECA|nr:hypothetical protein I7I52_12674 [Histoplasma capsulatum]QSS73409.1 hypothetical protein I7I50_01558 [Histoplasma capsulatum G186AR]